MTALWSACRKASTNCEFAAAGAHPAAAIRHGPSAHQRLKPQPTRRYCDVPEALPKLPYRAMLGDVRGCLANIGRIFGYYGDGESGCRGIGFQAGPDRYFIKHVVNDRGQASQLRAIEVHARVQHPTLVPLIQTFEGDMGPILAYPWVDGQPLRHSLQMTTQPLSVVLRAIHDVVDLHKAIDAAGFVSIDLYDGNLLFGEKIWLIDVDEYRLQPYVLNEPRTLGSTRFMAPEEFVQGSILDSRTMVYQLGRAMAVLLDPPSGQTADRCPELSSIIGKATQADPGYRYQKVEDLAADLELALARAGHF